MNCRFIASDGTEHTVNYIADEKGYRVVGEAIATTKPAARPAPVPRPAPAPVADPAPAPLVRLVSFLPQPIQYVPYYHYLPMNQPIQYVRLPTGAPATGDLPYVSLAGAGHGFGQRFNYIFDGSKYVLEPIKEDADFRATAPTTPLHPNIVYSLIK